MVDHSRSAQLRLAEAGEFAMSAASAYRAEAVLWERLAAQISLLPDQEYLLALARELRAKAAAVEAQEILSGSSGGA